MGGKSTSSSLPSSVLGRPTEASQKDLRRIRQQVLRDICACHEYSEIEDGGGLGQVRVTLRSSVRCVLHSASQARDVVLIFLNKDLPLRSLLRPSAFSRCRRISVAGAA